MKLSLLSFSLFAQIAFGAGYGVPVPPELKAHAYFDLKEGTAQVKAGVLSVDYQLPAGLVGKNADAIHFEGKVQNNFIDVEGRSVVGVCMVTRARPLTCMLKYPGLEIDAPSRDAALAEQFSGQELVLRSQVALAFSNDPAGVLTIEVTRPQ